MWELWLILLNDHFHADERCNIILRVKIVDLVTVTTNIRIEVVFFSIVFDYSIILLRRIIAFLTKKQTGIKFHHHGLAAGDW